MQTVTEPASAFATWAIIVATLGGPIAAVQAQKWIERRGARKHKKIWIFETLMSTRDLRLSPDHVRALNMIEVCFCGQPGRSATKKEKAVIEARKMLMDHLDPATTPMTPGDAGLPAWTERTNQLHIELLSAIAIECGYEFDKVQIKREGYAPAAYGHIEDEQTRVRRLAIEVLSGEKPIKMEVTGFPVDPAFRDVQLRIMEGMAGAAARGAAAAQSPPSGSPGDTA